MNRNTIMMYEETITEKKIEPNIDPLLKRRLLIYLLVSMVGYFLLVLPYIPFGPFGLYGIRPRAGVSAPLFMLIQAGFLYYIIPEKKPLMVLIPIFILSLNAFISANTMWRVANLFVSALLYGLMANWIVNGISLKDTSLNVFGKMIETFFLAFSRIPIPFRWLGEARKTKTSNIKRIAIGAGIAITILLFIIPILSQADMIFSIAVSNFFTRLSGIIRIRTILRVIVAFFAGMYLFGILYGIMVPIHKKEKPNTKTEPKGDCLIINIVLTSVLLVYTLFVIIQIRYLFAPPDSLPHGLTFEAYARRGFFELLFLTGVNIVFILLAVWMTKSKIGRGAKVTKILCQYLCAITVFLLISSFYRMWLHGTDDGLTRMRFLVFGFLIFEAIGLVATFFYITKPKFNIVAVYGIIALTYFLLLNLVPMDRIIARDQVNRYFETGRGGIHYATRLSADAAPEIARLLQSENSDTRMLAENYFLAIEEAEPTWRQWNLSVHRASRLRG